MYVNCCGLLCVTAALHALILVNFYLLIPGLANPGLVVFQ